MLTPPAVWDRNEELLSGARRQDRPRWQDEEALSVSSAQRLGDRSEHARFLRERLCARPQDQLGVRGQPADHRAARRIWRERLLRPRQQVAAALLVRRATRARVFTCLSSDIVNHEFGHAVLDGLRPHYYESVGAQTAAFHEFMGDLTAILMAFRNNAFRKVVLKESNGKLDQCAAAGRAGAAVRRGDRRTRPICAARLNHDTMKELAGNLEPHALSEVHDRRHVRHPHGGVCQASQKNEVEALRRQAAARSRATCERWPTPFPGCRCSPSSRSICCRPAR